MLMLMFMDSLSKPAIGTGKIRVSAPSCLARQHLAEEPGMLARKIDGRIHWECGRSGGT